MVSLHSYKDDDLHFHAIEQHVRKATSSDTQSYDSLIAYFETKLDNNDPHHDILLARAILVWICQLTPSDLSRNPSTPGGMIKQMKERRIEYAKVFKIFCRYADIECEVITGRAKAIRYQAGDSDSAYIQDHTWNAFKSGDTWHLVHPQWCIHSIVGFQHGGEYRIASDSTQNVEHLRGRDGVSMWQMNDFWFCTNPEIFVQRCFPDDSEWQCLPNDKMIGSVAKFMALPDLRQGFYKNYLKLLSEPSCMIDAKCGQCQVSFLARNKRGKELVFSYELLTASVDNIDINSLPLLVLYTPNQKDVFTFELSLPAAGIYRLKIRTGSKGQHPLINCCEVKIDCKKADPNCKILPMDTGIQGWGFSQNATDAGLKKPSTSGAKIAVDKEGQQAGQIIYSAIVDQDEANDREFSAYIHNSDNRGVVEPAIVTFDGDNRRMNVKAPNNKPLKDSALVLKTKNRNEPASNEKSVANYLLVSSDDFDEKDDKTQQNEARKKIRAQEKIDKKLEKNNLLKTKRDQRQQEMDDILAKIDNMKA